MNLAIFDLFTSHCGRPEADEVHSIRDRYIELLRAECREALPVPGAARAFRRSSRSAMSADQITEREAVTFATGPHASWSRSRCSSLDAA